MTHHVKLVFQAVITVLACLAYTRADIFSGQSLVPTVDVYSSINNGPGTRRSYPATPAPIYEDNMDDIQPTYGSQTPLFNVINTPFPSARRSDIVVNVGHTYPYSSQATNQVLFYPAYKPTPVISGRLSAPVTFTTHTHSTPLVNAYSGPVLATTYGQGSFASHTPIGNQAAKTTITYSEAPVVPHVAFTSHRARYVW